MNVLTVQYGSPQAASQFAQSLRDTGFAVLTHHPISTDLIHDTFQDWAKFFSNPAKMNYRFKPELQSGYFPFQTENAKHTSIKDLKEFFHYYPWTELPAELPKNTITLFNALQTLGSELLECLQNETPSEIKKNFSMPLPQMVTNSDETLLRPIHYPPLQGNEEPGAIRAAAHEDINIITLLPSATAPGLQVQDVHSRWHNVPCDPDSIVINAGDMLQMCSGGYYKSTTHQVINPMGEDSQKSRYSMPLFLHARPEVRLSELHTAESYLQERLLQIGLLKKP